MLRIGNIVLGKVDVKGGEFTYGNRIALIDIFRDKSLGEYEQMKQAFKEVYGYTPRLLPIRMRYRWLMDIVEGVAYWCEVEQRELDYTPTADEVAAGVEDYQKKIGCLGTIEALAEKFGQDPDTILKWSYSKVFGFLRKDLLEAKFRRRYDEVIKRKTSGGVKKYHK